MYKISSIFSLVCCILGSIFFASPVTAQDITTDGTTSTTVDSDGNGNYNIQQGDRAGNNLFHSFDDFSVPTNGSASFDNAADISNIFNRVTGGNISNIDGLIEAQGGANLFLINPAGIVFGSGARLQIGGSFFGTTADSISFTDGEFSATDLDNPPLLTVNAPIGLNFRDNPGDIVNGSFVQNEVGDEVGLEVQPGNNLSLIGGDINFEAGEVTARGGRVEFGGLSSAGTITIEPGGSLSFPEGVARANVTFSNAADVDVLGEGGGDISINANNIELFSGEFGASRLRAGILSTSSNMDAQAGNINLDATGTVSINDGSFLSNSTFGQGNAGQVQIESTGAVQLSGSSIIFNTVEAGADGNSAGIFLNAQSLSITEGSQLITAVQGTNEETVGGIGNAGNVIIDANEAVSISGSGSAIFSDINQGAEGSAGDIEISGNSFTLRDGAFLEASTDANGSSGNITVDVDGEVSLANNAQIFSNVESNAVVEEEARSTVLIDAGSFSIEQGSFINTSTFGQGNAGNIEINGNSFTLSDGAFLSSSTFGSGDAGGVTVDVDGAVSLNNNAQIFNSVEAGGDGDSQGVTINAQSLALSNGSQIQTLVRGVFAENNDFGQGSAGDISINVEGALDISGFTDENQNIPTFSSAISSDLGANSIGEAGNISIIAGSLSLNNGGLLSSSTFGEGNAGDIKIEVGDDLNIDGTITIGENTFRSGVFTSIGFDMVSEARGVGRGGNIEIAADSLTISNGAFTSSDTFGEGDAGNITLDIQNNLTLEGNTRGLFNGVETDISGGISSQVQFDAVGDAGDITIEAGSLTVSDANEIANGTRGLGDAGDVSITVDDFVILSNSSNIRSNVEPGGIGNGGDIKIDARSLTLETGSQIGALVFREDSGITGGRGTAGNITIDTTDSVTISGVSSERFEFIDSEDQTQTRQSDIFSSGILASVEPGGTGRAGNIFITTGDFKVADGGLVDALTANTTELPEDSIDRGNITINADTFEATGGGQVITTTRGIDDAGDINLNIEENIDISGSDPTFADRLAEFGDTIVNNQGAESGIFANATEGGTGEAGSIRVNAEQLNLSEQGTISAANRFDTDSSDTDPSETGGNIELSVDDSIVLQDNSLISAQAFGNANGGNLTIDTNFVVAFPDGNNDIVANAEAGEGGVITINAESVLGLTVTEGDLSDSIDEINASSDDSTLDGDVIIDTSDINPIRRAAELPVNTVEPDRSVAQACAYSPDRGVANSLVIRGRGGVAESPIDSLTSELIMVDGQVASNDESDYTVTTGHGDITIAQGAVKTKDGRIVLTAAPSDATRLPQGSANCS